MSALDPRALGEKVGPLPIGVWLLGIGGGLAAALYVRNRNAASSSPVADPTTTAGGTLPTTGDPAATVGGGSVGAYQEPPYPIPDIVDRFTTNRAWNNAIAADVTAGVKAAQPKAPTTPAKKAPAKSKAKKAPARPARTTYYTVKKGDTVSGIAAHFHTSVSHLESLNHGLGSHVNLIRPGDRIRVA